MCVNLISPSLTSLFPSLAFFSPLTELSKHAVAMRYHSRFPRVTASVDVISVRVVIVDSPLKLLRVGLQSTTIANPVLMVVSCPLYSTVYWLFADGSSSLNITCPTAA